MTQEQKAELAVKMVIMDAIEKQGNVGTAAMIQYMNSEAFEKAVQGYLSLMN